MKIIILKRSIQFSIVVLISFILLLFSTIFLKAQSADIIIKPSIIQKYIATDHQFSGLASYLNSTKVYYFKSGKMKRVKSYEGIELLRGQFLIFKGRFNSLVLFKGQLPISFDFGRKFELADHKSGHQAVLFKNSEFPTRLYGIMDPLRIVAEVKFNAHLLLDYLYYLSGEKIFISLILLAFIIKIILVPLDLYSLRIERQIKQFASVIEPKIKEIKKNFVGEEAHNKTLNLYRELNISAFYRIKSISPLLLQVPIWIVLFDVLASSSIFEHSYIWVGVKSANPDQMLNSIGKFGFIEMDLNLLPVLFLIISLGKVYLDNRNLKLNMSTIPIFVIFVIFYGFPSVFVLYWILVTFVSIPFKTLLNYYEKRIFND